MTEGRGEVGILGAGLFGAALAYYLASRGTAGVRVVDLRAPPRPASGTAASAGILTYQGWDAWDLSVVRESAEEYGRLAGEEAVEPPLRNGGLRVARTEEGVAWLERVHRSLVRVGVPARWVGPGEARDVLPLADLGDLRRGLFTPDDAVFDPVSLRDGFLRAAQRAGVEVETLEAPVGVASVGDGGWRLGGDRPGFVRALVVACGAATKQILATLGHPVALAPFRAQAARLRPRPLFAPFPTLHDLDLELYLRPCARGRVLVGDGTGSREEDPFAWEPAADASFLDRTVGAVRDLLDGAASFTTEEAWAGLCVASPDAYPLVGPVPGAPALFMASGFNGFGSMRAAGLARRLADALVTGEWAELRPADPGRFPAPPLAFAPRPVFPLETGEGRSEGPVPAPRPPTVMREGSGMPVRPVTTRTLTAPGEVDQLRWTRLSEWFDPFLPIFAKDALRTAGRVEVGEGDGAVHGLFLLAAGEGVASGFTRDRRLAERYLDRAEAPGIYLEHPWRAGGTPVEIFAADLRDGRPSGSLRNPVHIAGPDELPAIRSLMRAELGPGVDPWFATLPRPEETAFVCAREGRVLGVSWLTRVGPYARGHSFVVHPRYRGLGIGTDLLFARMLWLRRTGGRSVVSEIYDANAASRIAAERAGMALVGRMYHFPGAAGQPGERSTPAAPRTSGTPRPSGPSASRSSGTGP